MHLDAGSSERHTRKLSVELFYSNPERLLNEHRSRNWLTSHQAALRARIDGEGPIRRSGKDPTHSTTKSGRSSDVEYLLLARHDYKRVWCE